MTGIEDSGARIVSTHHQDEHIGQEALDRRGRRRQLVAGGGVVALLATMWFVYDASDASPTLEVSSVEIATVVRGPVFRDVRAEGLIVAAESRPVIASSAGRIRLLVTVGQKVERSQVLGAIQNPSLESELRAQEADL